MDKLWWWFNRKPSDPISTYLSFLTTGFVVGLLFLLFLICTIQGFWIYSCIFLVLIILMLLVSYRQDKRSGYVDALYKTYLEKRERIGRKLGKIKDEGS